MDYRIFPISLALVRRNKWGLLYPPSIQYQVNEEVWLPINIWLLKGGGKTILVDTGLQAEEAMSVRKPAAKNVIGFEEALRERGVGLGDIDLVILTHLHYDHVMHLPLLKGVPVVVQDRRDRIMLTNANADTLLEQAIAGYRRGGISATPASIPIPASEDRLAMIVHLVPVRGAAHDIFSQSAMLLLITPVDRAAVPTAEVLQGLFDLTPAEARVARGIGLAQSIDALAAAQGVSRETVRSQLKLVLAKTGLNRQAELVSLLAGLPTVR